MTPHRVADPADSPAQSVLTVYVPRGATHRIDPTSGVCSAAAVVDGRLLVDYESNRYGAANIVTFADRVHFAGGRHLAKYPTVARGAFPSDQLTPVGIFDQESGTVTLFGSDEAALVADWLGVDQVPPEELLAGGRTFETYRTLAAWRSSGDPRLMAQAELYLRTIGRLDR